MRFTTSTQEGAAVPTYPLPSPYRANRDANHRGFSKFILYACTDDDCSVDTNRVLLFSQFIPVGDDNYNHSGEGARLYDPKGTLGSGQNRLDIAAAVTPVTTDKWRAEFVQFAPGPFTESGPRVWELDGFGDDVTMQPVSVQGQASLPNYTPPAALLVLAGGMDGTLYGGAESELNGSFTVEADVPDGIERVLIHAVDPTNPEAFASAIVELNPSAVLAAKPLKGVKPRTAKTVLANIEVNAKSTADVMVLSASGGLDRSVATLSPQDQAAAARIAQMLDSTTMRMCSAGPSAEIMEVLRDVVLQEVVLREVNEQNRPEVRTEFDKIVGQPGSLLERLRAGQQLITVTVKPSNKADIDVAPKIPNIGPVYGFKWVYQNISTRLTRNSMAAASQGAVDGAKVKLQEVLLDDLEKMADIIWTDKNGNCMENAFIAAYLATRFPELKQVAYVGLERAKSENHAVAIACTENNSVFDLAGYLIKMQKTKTTPIDIPPEMLKAECYVIDPWGTVWEERGYTELLTQEYVEADQWTKVVARCIVFFVSLNTPQQRVVSALDSSEGAVPACTGPGTASELCTPFNDPIDVSQFNRIRIDFNITNPVEINGIRVDPDERPTSLLDWGHTGSFEGDTYRLHWSTVGVGNVKQAFDIYARLNARHSVIYDLAYTQTEGDLDSNSVYFLRRGFVATDIPLAEQSGDRLKFILKEPEQQVCERIFEHSDFQRKNENYERMEELGSCDGSRQLSVEFYVTP